MESRPEVADIATAALFKAFDIFVPEDSQLRFEELGRGVAPILSGAGIPTLNGVVTRSLDSSIDEIRMLAARFAGHELPWSIQLCRRPSRSLVESAKALGLLQSDSVPLMVKDLEDTDARALLVNELVDVTPRQQSEFLDALADGFEVPAAVLAPLVTTKNLTHPDVHTYARAEEGRLIATAQSVYVEDSCVIFNVAVIPEARSQGLGREMMTYVLAEAARAGNRRAVLQSSPVGIPLYSSLGFAISEEWTYLVA